MYDVRNPVTAPSLYEEDEYAWYFAQIAALREGRLSDLDRDNLAEFLEDVSKQDRRELESRFQALLLHILKAIHQPERLSRSWIGTILHQQDALRSIFGYSKILANAGPELLRKSYPRAVREAAAETGLPRGSMPTQCGWSVEELLEYEPPSMPGGPPRQ